MLPPRLQTELRVVRSVGVITGAGVSAESGIRTYRGQGGLYDDPAEGDRTVEALTGTTLQTDPDRTWRAVADLARMSGGAEPNAAHHAIAAIERKVERFALLTQNVDGLHGDAGSENVIEIHGNVRRTLCMACGARGRLAREELAALAAAPTCTGCGGTLRPDVILFGETLPLEETQRMRQAFTVRIPDLVITAGTTALFPYIQAPILLARQVGHVTVEVNPERTDLSGVVDWFLQGKAGDILPGIADAL